jgi:hypothetical protein
MPYTILPINSWIDLLGAGYRMTGQWEAGTSVPVKGVAIQVRHRGLHFARTEEGVMNKGRIAYTAVLVSAAVVAMGLWAPVGRGGSQDAAAPRFQVDPFWPKPLPNNWLLGQVAGIAVDSEDHIWIVQRPEVSRKTRRARHKIHPVPIAASRLLP